MHAMLAFSIYVYHESAYASQTNIRKFHLGIGLKFRPEFAPYWLVKISIQRQEENQAISIPSQFKPHIRRLIIPL
jgi:hypothetical protein